MMEEEEEAEEEEQMAAREVRAPAKRRVMERSPAEKRDIVTSSLKVTRRRSLFIKFILIDVSIISHQIIIVCFESAMIERKNRESESES